MKKNWTQLSVILAVAASAAIPVWANAQAWQPNRTVEYTVPSGPGAALDAAARKLKEIIEKNKLVAQPMVITNKSGGSGTIAINTLLQRTGNPHWLTTFTTGMVNARAIGAVPVSYADLTPIVVMFEESLVVAVRADSPIRNAKDLVAKLTSDPSSLSVGVATSVGNHIHVGIAKPLKAAGVNVSKLTVVPYKSSAESMTALLGGHIDVISASSPNVISQLQAGAIRVLAVATPERLSGALASVPTWKEQGVNESYTSVQGVLGPKGMTPEQIRFWEGTMRKVSETSEWKEFLAAQNWRPRFMESAEMKKYLAVEYAATKALIDELNLTKK